MSKDTCVVVENVDVVRDQWTKEDNAELLESRKPAGLRTAIEPYWSRGSRLVVSRLYTRAYATKISVQILTKDEQRATIMKDINGGVKILPGDSASRPLYKIHNGLEMT
jgi:hypothetical protein